MKPAYVISVMSRVVGCPSTQVKLYMAGLSQKYWTPNILRANISEDKYELIQSLISNKDTLITENSLDYELIAGTLSIDQLISVTHEYISI